MVRLYFGKRGNNMLKRIFIIPTLFCLLICSSSLWGNECAKCHMQRGVKESPPTTDPILIKTDGQTRSISLADAFAYHGHSCPGVTTTFRAIQYGIKLLYGSDVPEQGDLVVFSRTSTQGSRDMLDLLLIDQKGAKKTVIPKDMKAGRDNFFYTFYRKSTATAVDIQLKPENFPQDFFWLKKKQASRKLPSEEWNILHDYMKNIILTFQTMPFEELFRKPEPYKVITWGEIN
jgi:formylmethanofuran dehydrogenase subunit E